MSNETIETLKNMVALQSAIDELQFEIAHKQRMMKGLNNLLWQDFDMPGTDGDTVQIEIGGKLWELEMCFPDEGDGIPTINPSSHYRIKDGEIIAP